MPKKIKSTKKKVVKTVGIKKTNKKPSSRKKKPENNFKVLSEVVSGDTKVVTMEVVIDKDDKVTGYIAETTNYDKFTIMSENRVIKESHVKKLMKSIKKEDLGIPIILNDKGLVCDGQHRLAARTNLGVPIPYTVSNVINNKHLAVLNNTQDNWNQDDYINYFSNIPSEPNHLEYIKYTALKNEYKSLFGGVNVIGHNELMAIVLGYNAYTSKIKSIYETGELKFNRPLADVKKILDWMLVEVSQELTARVYRNRAVQRALLYVYSLPTFDKTIFRNTISKKSNKIYFESENFRKLDTPSKIEVIITKYNTTAKIKVFKLPVTVLA